MCTTTHDAQRPEGTLPLGASGVELGSQVRWHVPLLPASPFSPSWNLMLACHLEYCHVRRKLYKNIHDMGKPLLFRIYWIHLENASSVLSKATHPSKSLNYVPVKQNIRECVCIYTHFSFGCTWTIKVHSHP